MLVDLIGKRNKVRSVPMPSWAKQAMDEYASAANVVDGILFRPINKAGRLTGERMTEQAIYNLVTHYAASLGIRNLAPTISAERLPSWLTKEAPGWIRYNSRPDIARYRLQNDI